jgi:hypothetical protein
MLCRYRTAVRVAGGGLLLAAAMLFAPGRAAAECGDYVTILSDGPGGTPGEHGPAHHGPAKPCHGPGCSSTPGPSDHPLTAPETEPVGPKGWANRSAGDAAEAGGPGRKFTLTPAGRTVHRPQSVFHPPRAT